MGRKKKAVNPRTVESVRNGIKILEMALSEDLSLSEASRRHNFGRNYVSDLRARVKENYQKKNVDKQTYKSFVSLLKAYNKR